MANEKIRVGIIGANVGGSWGTRAHLPALRALPQFEVVAVCTTRHATADETAQQFSIPVALADPQQLVDHPEVDVVVVCVRVPRMTDWSGPHWRPGSTSSANGHWAPLRRRPSSCATWPLALACATWSGSRHGVPR